MWNMKTDKPETNERQRRDTGVWKVHSLVPRIAKLRLRGKRDIEGPRDQLIGATERRKGRKLA